MEVNELSPATSFGEIYACGSSIGPATEVAASLFGRRLFAGPMRIRSTSCATLRLAIARLRKGVASTFLAERCNDQPVPVFPSVAKHFHLPEADVDIIMVGAWDRDRAFPAFLQERRAVGARGCNWLFRRPAFQL